LTSEKELKMKLTKRKTTANKLSYVYRIGS
jgi:hypothetical protein